MTIKSNPQHSIIQLQLCTRPWVPRPHVYETKGALMLTKANSCSLEKNKRSFLGLPCDQVLLQCEPLVEEESLQSGHKENTEQISVTWCHVKNYGSINSLNHVQIVNVSNFAFFLWEKKATVCPSTEHEHRFHFMRRSYC